MTDIADISCFAGTGAENGLEESHENVMQK